MTSTLENGKRPVTKKKWILSIVALSVFVTFFITTSFLLTTSTGIKWLLSTVSHMSSGNITFTGVSGTLSTLRTKSICFISEDRQIIINKFAIDWQPKELLSGQLKIQQLSAKSIDVLLPHSKDPTEPAKLPETLQIPISIFIDYLKIARLRLFSKETNIPSNPDLTVTKISARFHSSNQKHHLRHLSFHSDFGALTASAQLNDTQPFNLKSKLFFTGLNRLGSLQLPTTQLQVNISGDLTRLNMGIMANGKLLRGHGKITLHPFSTLPVSSLQLSLSGLNPQDISPNAPSANISVKTHLRKKNDSPTLTGRIVAENTKIKTFDHGGLPVHKLSTSLALSPDQLQLNNLQLYLADHGKIFGDLAWQFISSSGSAQLAISQLNPLALDSRTQRTKINGNIHLDGNTKIQHGFLELQDKMATLDAKITHREQVITLEKLQLSRQHSTLSGQGEFHLDRQNFFKLDAKLSKFNIADFIQTKDSLLNLTLKLTGNFSPQLDGKLDFKFINSSLASHFVNGGGILSFSHPNKLSSDIDLKIGDNKFLLAGNFGKPGNQMKLNIAAPQLDQIQPGISGSINLKADLAGSFDDPALRFQLNGSHLAIPGDQYLNQISGHGHMNDEAVYLKINAADYQLERKKLLDTLAIAITGHKSHHQIKTSAQIKDGITINLQSEGGLVSVSQKEPTKKWQGKISHLSATGPLPFNLDTPARLKLASDYIHLEKADLSIANGKLNIIDILWTPQQWHTQGNFTGVSLRPGNLTEQNQQTLQLGGTWNIFSSKNKNSNFQIVREKGDWTIPGDFPSTLGLQTLQLDAATSSGKLSGQLLVKGEQIGETSASFSVPLTSLGTNWKILPNAMISGQVYTRIQDISWIGKVFDDNIKSGGKFSLSAKLRGSLDAPELEGKVSGENLAFILLDQGIQLENGELDAHFDHSTLQIDTFEFSAPDETPPEDPLLTDFKRSQNPGKLNISGKIGLTGESSNLEILLDRVPLAHETNYWILASGNINAQYNNNILEINGTITSDAGLIGQPPAGRPQLADDIIIGKPPEQTPNDTILNLDATMDLGDHFYIRASGLEGKLAGQVHITNNKQQKLFATGSISTRNAVFEAYGQKLTVKRGIVNFNGPLDDPGLNVLAVRKNLPVGTGNLLTDTGLSSADGNLPVEAGIEVLGTVNHPKIRLVSTPTVPDSEKLSWILFGRPLQSGGIDTALLLTAASSILSGQPGSNNTINQISQTLGVDEISFRQSGTGGNPISSQIGVVGKRLSSRAYLSYERGLTTASIGVTKLAYSLTPRITIVTQAGFDNALDVFYTFQFD